MTRQVLSQAGTSLADVYDVKGSVAGIERLDVAEIKGVHDLGPQIHSERLISFFLIASSGAVAQSTAWNVTLGGFPDSINRLMAIYVLANNSARVDACTVSLNNASSGIDQVLWEWDSADDLESRTRWNDGAAVGTFTGLRPIINVPGGLPNLITRVDDERLMPTLVFRGLTLGFGAGDVTTRALIQIARPNSGAPPAGAPSSHGLPIPSW